MIKEKKRIFFEHVTENDKKIFFLTHKIDLELQIKKNKLHQKVNYSLAKFEIGIFKKFIYACLYFLIYPITIKLTALFLQIFSGIISIVLGFLLILSILFLPLFLIFYCATKDQSKKDFYYFLISLSWISIFIIFKGLYKIIKGVFLSIYLFFNAYYLICTWEINNINTFNENIRIGLGGLKMKKITELNKIMNRRNYKTVINL